MGAVEHLSLDEWRGPDHTTQSIRISNPDDISAAIRKVDPSVSAQLMMEANDNTLIIGAWNNIYAAGVIMADGDIYDRLCEPPSEGTIDFLEGGQSVDMPKRHAITREEAIVIATEFFQSGSVNLDHRWQKQ